MQHFENNLKGNKNKLSSIFLADDDPDDHLLFSMALNKADPSIILTSFYSCTELFTYIEKTSDLPDVIFLDLNIPGNENFEAVQRLMTFFTTVPVIIYSTSNAQRDMDNALCYGASAYLVKPGNIQLLEKQLKQLIESYSAEEPPISEN